MSGDYSIAGGWLGTYRYGAMGREPVRFEASFVGREGSGFSGTILDDCNLGEAAAVGIQSGRVVEFTKTYVNPPSWSVTGPVVYEGTISENGRTMNGRWRLDLSAIHGRRRRLTGSWEARRIWNAAEKDQPAEEPESTAIGRELAEVSR